MLVAVASLALVGAVGVLGSGLLTPAPGAESAAPASAPADSPNRTAGSASPASSTPMSGVPAAWPLRLEEGLWPTPHVQGIAVDQERGFVYYSFTTLLVKADLAGEVVGTVGGFTGHLGDLDYNPGDGRVYGSLEYKEEQAFYIAIFDADRIDRVDMDAQNSPIVSTVYLPEVVEDFTADLDGDGVFAGDTGDTGDHRYGCSGIDGVAFGPGFGSVDGPRYLTVAYGVYRNDARDDNDHQVLLQYDIGDWAGYERPLVEGDAHRTGPAELVGKYFVFTGNTHFGVQSLEYDPWLARWILAVYPGSKAAFPNYSLFMVGATAEPRLDSLRGLGDERGLLLPLADDGLADASTGIRGWRRDLSYGVEALGGGRYYVASPVGSSGASGAVLTLESWTGDPADPFGPAG